MEKKVPKGVQGTAALNLVLGVFFILLGSAMLYDEEIFLSSIESDFLDAYLVFFHIMGGLFIMVGMFSTVLFVGLMLMKNWARVNDELFFSVVIIGGLIFGGFVVAFLPPLMVCTGIAVTMAVISILVIMYLRNPHTIKKFEEYELAKKAPKLATQKTMPTTQSVSIQERLESTEQASAETKVPENMMLCPNCQALNLKAADFCKVCATDLHPESEETLQKAEEMIEYVENQIEDGRQMGVNFTETESLLQAARMMVDAKQYQNAAQLLAHASANARELIMDYEALGPAMKRAEEALDVASASGKDTPEIKKLMKLAIYHRSQGEYKKAMGYAKRITSALSGKR